MDKQKSVKLGSLKMHFDLKKIAGDEQSLKRRIYTAEINRPGFELAGFFQHSDLRRIVIFGEKEIAFIKEMQPQEQYQRFEKLTGEDTPAIIICKSLECPVILEEICARKNFPLFVTDKPTGRVSIQVSAFLDDFLAPDTTMHGVFMSIHGKGVIIKGDSGIGKSEIALDLIRLGHLLVADDCVELYRIGSNIMGRSPKVLSNMLEIRGIGVINVVKLFGIRAILDKHNVDLVIQLERWMPSKEYTRIGTEEINLYENILGVDIPKAVVPVTGGRSMSAVIEAAVMNMRLKETGYDSSQEFINRIMESIKENASIEEEA